MVWINRIRDWGRQWTQFSILVFSIVLGSMFDLQDMIVEFIREGGLDIDNFEWVYQLLLILPRPVFVIVLTMLWLCFFRKWNREKVLKQNLELIVRHSYFGYWFCSVILGYQTLSLKMIPIPMQFKLVFKNTYTKYEYMEGIQERTCSNAIEVVFLNTELATSAVNFVLVDTYPIPLSKLPELCTSLPTIIVTNKGERGVRTYNRYYLEKIANIFHELPCSVLLINVFATTSAAHVYYLANDVFKTGGRDSVRRIRIYEQTSDGWTFELDQYIEIKC